MKLIAFLLRHIIPVGLVAGGGLFVFSAATPPTTSRIDGLGVDLMSSPPLTAEMVEGQLAAIEQAGVEYVHIEVNWSLIETSQDVYNWSNVMPLDLFFGSAQAREIKSVAVVTGFPVYLSGTGTALDQKTVGSRWEKFIQAAVDHFGEQVDIWQIGDEINSSMRARSLAQAEPVFYAKMLKAASKIIKGTNPNDSVWMGSLVSATASDCAVNPLTFLLEINAAKGWKHADVITYQPARGAVAPEAPTTALVNQGCASSMPGSSSSISSEVQAVQDLARQLGGKQVYITGLSWTPDELLELKGGRAIDVNVLHSDLLTRATASLMGNNSIPLIFWQVDPLYQAASMSSLANLTTMTQDSKSLGQLQGESGPVQEFRFQKGARIAVLAWRSQEGDSPQPVQISNLSPGKLLAYSADSTSLVAEVGTELKVNDNGTTVVMLNERPVLFIGKSGSWDEQVKASISDQLDLWRIGLQRSISEQLNQVKASFLQWLEDLFTQAKEDAVDWGEEQIRELLN